jgi:hypothetical protein
MDPTERQVVLPRGGRKDVSPSHRSLDGDDKPRPGAPDEEIVGFTLAALDVSAGSNTTNASPYRERT